MMGKSGGCESAAEVPVAKRIGMGTSCRRFHLNDPTNLSMGAQVMYSRANSYDDDDPEIDKLRRRRRLWTFEIRCSLGAESVLERELLSLDEFKDPSTWTSIRSELGCLGPEYALHDYCTGAAVEEIVHSVIFFLHGERYYMGYMHIPPEHQYLFCRKVSLVIKVTNNAVWLRDRSNHYKMLSLEEKAEREALIASCVSIPSSSPRPALRLVMKKKAYMIVDDDETTTDDRSGSLVGRSISEGERTDDYIFSLFLREAYSDQIEKNILSSPSKIIGFTY